MDDNELVREGLIVIAGLIGLLLVALAGTAFMPFPTIT